MKLRDRDREVYKQTNTVITKKKHFTKNRKTAKT